MNLLLKILIISMIPFFLNAQTLCNNTCNLTIDTDTNKSTNDLECTLQNMPTFTITASNVLNSDGTLKEYFETNNTVCDVLGWFEYEIPYIETHFPTLSKGVTQALTLDLSHLESKTLGGTTVKSQIHLDTDIDDKHTTDANCCDDEYDECSQDAVLCKNYNKDADGNIHKHRMKYIATHEFWHFIALNTGKGSEQNWVQEAPARNFEDIVYDEENPYLDKLFIKYFYKKNELSLLLSKQTLTKTSYNGFLFYKLLDNKCSYPDMYFALQEDNKLNARVNALSKNCRGVPDIKGDKLAGAFVLYNWAMLFNKKISLFDNVKESNSLKSMFRGKYKTIDKTKWKNTLDLTSYTKKTFPPFSAKSFLITHKTLTSDEYMNLTFKASGDLKLVTVRVKADGSSDVNDNFVMKSNDTAYDLSDVDRTGGLFVTLTNTTEKAIELLDLNLTKIRFSRNDETNIVTDHERGLMWQDEADTWLDSWYGAGRHCTALTLGDYNDWRVPTYDELIHILDLDGEDTYRYKIFEHLGPVGYWSLDRNGGVFPDSESAKVVNFGLATWIWINTSQNMNTRCVRTKE